MLFESWSSIPIVVSPLVEKLVFAFNDLWSLMMLVSIEASDDVGGVIAMSDSGVIDEARICSALMLLIWRESKDLCVPFWDINKCSGDIDTADPIAAWESGNLATRFWSKLVDSADWDWESNVKKLTSDRDVPETLLNAEGSELIPAFEWIGCWFSPTENILLGNLVVGSIYWSSWYKMFQILCLTLFL